MSVYTVSLRDTSSLGQVNVQDGTLLANLSVSAGRGPKGDGWTSVTYDENTGTFIFTSNDGLAYTSPDLRPELQTYVTAAEAAQAGAEAAETATEALFDQFGDQYLGSKASDPTVDNDGDPLTEGDIYFNTTDDVLKFYSGSTWVAPESIATTAATAAQAAQAAAETAETNAETAEANAATSATNAATSETNAGNSETAAASSAAAASTSADEAAASAASIDLDNIDINGGTIDGTVIGGSTAAAGSFTTGSFTGDVSFGDNDKAIFGAGSDLQIYHNTHSYIEDAGGGDLILKASDQIKLQNGSGQNMAVFNENGAVVLTHSEVTKLATTATGIDVTGTITSDGLIVDAAGASIAFTGTAGNNFITAKQGIKVDIDSDNNQGGTSFDITHGGATGTVFSASENGDISFYEDTGTTPKFFWDASSERLGIGKTNPATALDVTGAITATDITLSSGALNGVTSSDTFKRVVQAGVVGDINFYTTTTTSAYAASGPYVIITPQSAGNTKLIGVFTADMRSSVSVNTTDAGTNLILKYYDGSSYVNTGSARTPLFASNLAGNATLDDAISIPFELSNAQRRSDSGDWLIRMFFSCTYANNSSSIYRGDVIYWEVDE